MISGSPLLTTDGRRLLADTCHRRFSSEGGHVPQAQQDIVYCHGPIETRPRLSLHPPLAPQSLDQALVTLPGPGFRPVQFQGSIVTFLDEKRGSSFSPHRIASHPSHPDDSQSLSIPSLLIVMVVCRRSDTAHLDLIHPAQSRLWCWN